MSIIIHEIKKNFQNIIKKNKRKDEFVQSTLLSSDIIDKLRRKEISITDLLEKGVIEYISSEEQENTYICPDIEQLIQYRNDETKQYTHCDIPQAILGITALTSPYANHNQTPRITFQTSQAKQTCGYYALNWPNRIDKDTFLQYNCEIPLVKSISTKYLFSNGQNCIVAIAINGGYNQEDSIIINQSSIDRGAFNGCKFTFYISELEDSKENHGIPDFNQTIHIKDGNYSLLNKEGFISKGTIINKGDVIIGKFTKLPKDYSQSYKYQDKSTIYNENETAIIHKVISERNEDGKKFIKIALRKLRGVVIGDKFSSRAGLKNFWPQVTGNSSLNIFSLRESP